MKKYSSVCLGLTIANFIYQYFQAVPNYAVAIERSWFQITAIIVFGLVSWINK